MRGFVCDISIKQWHLDSHFDAIRDHSWLKNTGRLKAQKSKRGSTKTIINEI